MYLRQLKLKNFRCFEDATLDLPPAPEGAPQRNVTVLVGDNGSGKSTLLQAIAIGLLGDELRDSGLLLRNLVRQGAKRAALTASWEDKKASVKIEQKEASDYPASSGIAGVRVIGYGTHRRAPPGAEFSLERQEKRFTRTVQRIASLFTDEAELVPLGSWLPTVKGWPMERLKVAVPEVQVVPQLDARGDLKVEYRGLTLSDTTLSDGYRSFLAWFNDLLYRLTQLGYPDTRPPVVVLVDEVDLHLHPRWQQTVIDRISAALPDVQFVLTTHSPLVVGGVHRERLRVLVVPRTRFTIETPEEPSYGRTPDQILLSDAFGLRDIRPRRFQDKLDRLEEKVSETGDIEAAIQLSRLRALGEGAE